MSRYLFTAVVLGGGAILLAPVGVASATWELVDDFDKGEAVGWTTYDNLPPEVEPLVFDATSGAYHLQSTGVTDQNAMWATWDASEDPVFSNGFIRAKVRSDSSGGVVGSLLRLVTPVESSYFFLGDSHTRQFFIARSDTRVGSWNEFYLPGVTFQRGEDWIIEGGIVGDLLSMKVWRPGDPEPASPQLTWTDPEPLPNGLLAVGSYIDVRSSPVHIDTTFDDIYFHPPVRGDFNSDRVVDVNDIDLLSREVRRWTPRYRPQFDLNDDQKVDLLDHGLWVSELKNTWLGDANLDGEFNSSDMVQVFAAGKYEKAWVDQWGITHDGADWAEGDWNADGIFDSSDMVTAFVEGGYEQGLRTDLAAVPEPTSVLLLMTGLMAVTVCRRRSRP